MNEYKDLHGLIPGGAHTYSKGDDQFSENTPKYIIKGKGSHVLASDGLEYLECGMGLASVSIGHGEPEIVEAVSKAITDGTNFMRPSVLEGIIAEKFLSLIPHHSMIKFAKNGSTVTTAAVKLARAFTGRKLIAVPQGHPFYSYDDWFIGSTLTNHGIPSEISQLTVSFKHCSPESLAELFEKYPGQIAAVITEPEKNYCSNCTCGHSAADFLRSAIDITHDNGALFIIDEMQSGFRLDFPGSISKYNLKPDMATWGKGIANGFSFCCLTGTEEVMRLGGIKNFGEKKVFLVSTTHGAESTGLGAVDATIDFFKKNNVVKYNHAIGRAIHQSMKTIVEKHGLTNIIQVFECDWMPGIDFKDATKALQFKTIIIQEMVKQKVLFQGVFVPCYRHTSDEVETFCRAFEKAVEYLKNHLYNNGPGLSGESVKPVFRQIV
jgi:glutamate-1-semialdehyde aminotransferase